MGGKMQHGIDLVLVEDAPQFHAVTDVEYVQGTPFHGPFIAGAEIIDRHRQDVAAIQCLADMAADIAGATSDNDGLLHSKSLSHSSRSKVAILLEAASRFQTNGAGINSAGRLFQIISNNQLPTTLVARS